MYNDLPKKNVVCISCCLIEQGNSQDVIMKV